MSIGAAVAVVVAHITTMVIAAEIAIAIAMEIAPAIVTYVEAKSPWTGGAYSHENEI